MSCRSLTWQTQIPSICFSTFLNNCAKQCLQNYKVQTSKPQITCLSLSKWIKTFYAVVIKEVTVCCSYLKSKGFLIQWKRFLIRKLKPETQIYIIIISCNRISVVFYLLHSLFTILEKKKRREDEVFMILKELKTTSCKVWRNMKFQNSDDLYLLLHVKFFNHNAL